VLILGIETATQQVGCAIGGHEGVLGLFECARGRRHAETLAPAIEFVTSTTGIELGEISVVAVDVGPGLFTGMRVGLATAKAIAHALRVPMIGISSLDLLAFPLRHTLRTIVTVIDARRGELFYAFYRQVPGGVQRLGDLQVGTPDELLADLVATNDEHLLVGDGALRYREQLAEVQGLEFAEQWLAYPSAAPLVQLAHARALREDWVQPWELEPIYLRKPDAEINWATREGRAPALDTEAES
jgi:tRNA threonylcarbamoyladenosine biosynthesis protein TsaB